MLFYTKRISIQAEKVYKFIVFIFCSKVNKRFDSSVTVFANPFLNMCVHPLITVYLKVFQPKFTIFEAKMSIHKGPKVVFEQINNDKGKKNKHTFFYNFYSRIYLFS